MVQKLLEEVYKYAVRIRPKSIRLLHANCMFVGKSLNLRGLVENSRMKELFELSTLDFPEESIGKAIVNDNVYSFSKNFSWRECISIKTLLAVRKFTPLQMCAYLGSIKCFKFAVMNEQEPDAETIKCVVAGGNEEIARIIINKGIIFSNYGVTCVQFHRPYMYSFLCSLYGSDVIDLEVCLCSFNYVFFYYFEPEFSSTNLIKENIVALLEIASNDVFCNELEFLLSKYQCVDVSLNGSMQTALHIAASNSQYFAVKTLIDSGASVDCCDDVGETPLILAAESGNAEIVELLVSFGADINAADYSGSTALHLSAINNHSNIALWLLENGSDPFCKDCNGETPIDCAKMQESDSVLQMFNAVGLC